MFIITLEPVYAGITCVLTNALNLKQCTLAPNCKTAQSNLEKLPCYEVLLSHRSFSKAKLNLGSKSLTAEPVLY